MATKPNFGASPSGGGLTFGTPSSAPPFGSSLGSGITPSFGASPTPNFGSNPTPNFGVAATSSAPAFGGIGTPTFGATATPSFGTGTVTPSFGTGTVAPSFGGGTAAPSFGGGTAAPSFGGGAAAPAFGTGNAAPTFGTGTTAPSFGTGTTAPSFGTGTAAPTFGVGAPAPSFGVGTTAPNFGVGTAAPSFGTAAPSFGNTSLPSFGASSVPNLGGTSTFSFGTAAPASTTNTLNFGAPGSTSMPTLGGFNFGAASVASTASAAPASAGFSFGGGNTATTAAGGFGLGLNTTGLFGKPATTADPTKPATSASIGLGGVDSTGGNIIGGISGGTGESGTGTGNSTPAPKSVALPMELTATVDAFKANVRQRKQLSSDIARCSIRPLHKVDSDADALLRESTELSAALAARRRTANALRCRAGNALPAAERAHRIAETPHGLEYESADVVAWITEVVAEGENRLVLLRRQLEAAQQQLDTSHKPVTDEELALGMRRIHESFIAVAGRLQAVHQLVEAQKAQYLSLRRNILKDPTDIFAKKKGASADKSLNYDWFSKTTNSDQLSSGVVSDPLIALGLSNNNRTNSTTGPNPFSNMGSTSFNGLPFGFNKTQTTASSSTAPLGNSWSALQPGAFCAVGNQSSFGGLTGLGSLDQSPFSLQKPPAGNKRGKY